MNVIIFGPPGAGKGTQAQHIVGKFNLYQVSTGNLLREEVKNQTEIGKDIENTIYFNFQLENFWETKLKTKLNSVQKLHQ